MMKTLVAALAFAALGVAGCGTQDVKAAQDDNDRAPAAPPVAASQPAARSGPETDAPSLYAYVGKYVHDKVGGVPFLEHPKVRAAIEATGAPADAKALLRETDAVVTPLIRVGADRLYARGFEPASGGDVNWGLLIAADGSVAAICYSQPVDRDSRAAEWYTRGEKAFTLSEMCPSEAEEMTGSFGTWPIGPMPG